MVHQRSNSSLGIPYIFISETVKSPEMLYAHAAFGADEGGSGTVGMALGRIKINKKQSFAKSAAQNGLRGESTAKCPDPAAAHENVPRIARYSHISPMVHWSDLSIASSHALLLYTSSCAAPLERSLRVSDQSGKPGVHGPEN